MPKLVVPSDDGSEWPTLGPQVAQFIEAYLIFGPGDLRGQPARLTPEKRALLYRMYEVFPRGHPQAGRRRFKRCCVCLRKGLAKTEFAAWIAACELHPEAPVRCDGFDASGRPVGRPVTDPYIPLVAYTEEQSEELAYGALYAILSEGPLADDFDIGLERIVRKDGSGRAVALASAPDSRDGARTTFQHFDETHRFTLPRLREAHRTMMANIPKRRAADAWSLETTTAHAPGEGSVAEATHAYARDVASGRIRNAQLFYFYRWADERHDLSTDEGVRAAVLEASGLDAEWSDIEGILEQWRDPTTDRQYLRRVWLNQIVAGSDRAFDLARWRELARPDYSPPDGALITIGFDGSRIWDATGLVATEVSTGYQWVLGCWERPANLRPEQHWEVPADEVHQTVEAAMSRWRVWRMYCDPPYWETDVALWAGRYGDKTVVEWWTNRQKPMALALQGYANAIANGDISHGGDERLARHLGNAHRRTLLLQDEQQRPLWVIQKERSDSPDKIDLAMAAVLSWEARTDALASGATAEGDTWTYGAV
jgi:phage terminase large subunit-like protein